MTTVRALLLALALEAAEDRGQGRTTFRKRKTAYFATLFFEPPERECFGLLDTPDGIDVLWRPAGHGRRVGG